MCWIYGKCYIWVKLYFQQQIILKQYIHCWLWLTYMHIHQNLKVFTYEILEYLNYRCRLSAQAYNEIYTWIDINNTNTTIEKTTCKDFYWHIINTATHVPTSIHKWSDHYTNFHSAENNIWSRKIKIPIQNYKRYKNVNMILYIELFHVIIGYVTLNLKTLKPVTTVVKLMTLCISSIIAPRLMSSGLTGSIGGNISVT